MKTCRFSIENNQLICRTGLETHFFRQLNLVDLKKEEGILMHKGQPIPFLLDQSFTEEGLQCFRGALPAQAADAASQSTTTSPFTAALALSAVAQLAPLLEEALQRDPDWPGLFSPGLILTGETAALLPPGLYRFLSKNRPGSDPAALFDQSLSHPDLTGTAAARFTLAAALYTSLTGTAPYDGDTQEGIRENIRSGQLLPAHLALPELSRRASDTLQSLLSPAKKGPPEGSFADLKNLIQEAAAGNLTEPQISFEEKEARRKARRRFLQNRKKQRRRTLFLRRHKIKMGAAAVVLVPLLLLIFNPFTEKRQPANIGLGPDQVAALYYECFNSLNEPALRDIILPPTDTGDLDIITNFFITEKVRFGYEGKGGIVRADDWVQKGQPELLFPLNVFGVSDLTLRREALSDGPEPSDGRALYHAAYTYWAPDTRQYDLDYEGPTTHVSETRRDTLHLVEKKNRWFVDRIERRRE